MPLAFLVVMLVVNFLVGNILKLIKMLFRDY